MDTTYAHFLTSLQCILRGTWHRFLRLSPLKKQLKAIDLRIEELLLPLLNKCGHLKASVHRALGGVEVRATHVDNLIACQERKNNIQSPVICLAHGLSQR